MWMAPPSPNNHTNKRFQLSTDLTCIAALQGESLVVLGSNLCMPAMIRYLDHWATAALAWCSKLQLFLTAVQSSLCHDEFQEGLDLVLPIRWH
ncbi:hypothetical protein TNCV_2141401 [Trichonephila clavipes]|uniref:Uncharacterized protein n=1 Tax=Trichonephila clavipes TaxID=2585209 RepID=A0A8X6RX25_TRICX|nr:hypothetical protein TNCV_2141401 [Trichonephila clavipes]